MVTMGKGPKSEFRMIFPRKGDLGCSKVIQAMNEDKLFHVEGKACTKQEAGEHGRFEGLRSRPGQLEVSE